MMEGEVVDDFVANTEYGIASKFEELKAFEERLKDVVIKEEEQGQVLMLNKICESRGQGRGCWKKLMVEVNEVEEVVGSGGDLKAGVDAYTKLVVKKYGEDNANHPMNVHRDLWEMATGVMKKGRAFGIPTNSTSAPRMSSTASSDAYHTSDLTFDHMQRWNVAEERVTRLEEGNKQTDEKVDDILKILNEDPLSPN
ncbi:hypothetical protein Tco_0032117 [Tanacetum coccineum]